MCLLFYVASMFLASFLLHGGAIVERDLFGPWQQHPLLGMSTRGELAGKDAVCIVVLLPLLLICSSGGLLGIGRCCCFFNF